MASCEKCWSDAWLRRHTNPSYYLFKTQVEHYNDLLEERKGDPCSPRDQAGQFWDEKKQIDRRFDKTIKGASHGTT